ncbi:MAG: DUF5018 domain-containing protein [Bacteroidales bacterium]|nr:DUF5018 domain-containing protein [Bacteroidales bacterium]
MKKYFVFALGFAALLASCHQPEYIKPTTEELGLNSVSAQYYKGPLASDPSAIWTETVTSLDEDIVVHIPWFYPLDSDNVLTDITSMKVTASIDYNCIIAPPITILDLTQPHNFVFTDGRGEKHNIVIRGEITKLSLKKLTTFAVTDPVLVSIIDEDAKTVTVNYSPSQDISSCEFSYSVSPHASCSLDGLKKIDLKTIKSIDVTAHDGSVQKYKFVLTDVTVPKIPYGWRSGSETPLWAVDMESTLGMPRSADKSPSLAVADNKLIVCAGDGSTPIYLNRTSGAKEGQITLGGADASGFVKNDDAGNLLICNHTEMNSLSSDFKIWRTKKVSEAPSLLISYTNTTGFPLGHKMSVQGDIDGNATIVVPFEGTDASAINQIAVWYIKDGVVGEPEIVTLSGFIGEGWAPGYWSTAPSTIPAVVPLSANPEDGMFFSVYDEDRFYHIAGDYTMKSLLEPQPDAGNYNNNGIDVKVFNNARYCALLCTSHFPQWGGIPLIYIYDVTNLATVSGSVDACSAQAMAYAGQSFYVDGNGIAPACDVILVPSVDGYYMTMYYIDHNNRIVEAIQVDCIDK